MQAAWSLLQLLTGPVLLTPPTPLAALREVLARMEVLAPGLSPNCTTSRAIMWTALAMAVIKLEVLPAPATVCSCYCSLLLAPAE